MFSFNHAKDSLIVKQLLTCLVSKVALATPEVINQHTHVFAGPLNQGAVLIVKSCGINVSANVTYLAFNENRPHYIYSENCYLQA